MKKLTGLLLSGLLLTAPMKSPSTENSSEYKKIVTAVAKNITKEEERKQAFIPKGILIEDKTEDINSGQIRYVVFKDEKNLYFAFEVRKEPQKEAKAIDNFFNISEQTKLVISYPEQTNLLEVNQQGILVKQNPKRMDRISADIKKLYPLNEHEEAKEILENAESVLNRLIEKLPDKIERKVFDFLENSKEKERKNLENKVGGEKRKITIIPRYSPDKLFGQKLVSIHYQLKFDKNPTEVKIYSLVQLEDNQRIEQTINEREAVRSVVMKNTESNIKNCTWTIDLDKDEYTRTKEEKAGDDLIIDIAEFSKLLYTGNLTKSYGLRKRIISDEEKVNKGELVRLENQDKFIPSYFVETKEGNKFVIEIQEYKSLREMKNPKQEGNCEVRPWNYPDDLYMVLKYKRVE